LYGTRWCALSQVKDPAAGRRLRAFVETRRTDTGTWEEWAATVGLTKSALFALFAGKNQPSPDTERRIAAALGVSRAELVKAMDGE